MNGGVYGNHPNIDAATRSTTTATRRTGRARTRTGRQFRSTDFRDVYGTILKHWLDMPQATVLARACCQLDGGSAPATTLLDEPPNFNLRIPPVADYYFADPRLALVPIEHLDADRDERRARGARSRRAAAGRAAQVALFDAGFSLYWTRSAALAAPHAHLAAAAPPPRRRRRRRARPSGRTASSSTRAPGRSTRATSTRSARIPSSSPTCSRTATAWP